jgi:glucose-6-phosphate isomerase
MDDSPQAPLSLDASAATDILTRQVNEAHMEELDARVAAVVQELVREQEQGYAVQERNLRGWTQSHLRTEDIEATVTLAERIRERFKAFVLVGIGGSDLGGRTLHDTLDDPFHNQRDPKARYGAPEIYFTGDTFDPKRLLALLDLLEKRGLLHDTCVNVVSKSGKTGETIAAAMVIRERMECAGIRNWTDHFVATTGQNAESVLYEMNRQTPFFGMLPVPEGVGGRFSFASPVGLLPFAVTATDEQPHERIESGLAGYAEAHQRGLLPAAESDNTAAQLARWWHLGEQYGRKTDLVFCNYADDARLGDWFTQLYEESVQERGGGLNVIGTRGPTGNHSILNGILRGPHDKLVLLVRWEDFGPDAEIPRGTGIGGDLKFFEGLPLSAVQDASCRATADDYLANGVPTATLTVAQRDAYHLFLLMRTLMDAVAIKGCLQDLAITPEGKVDPAEDLTYRQDGVEGYKIRTRKNAEAMQQRLRSESSPAST